MKSLTTDVRWQTSWAYDPSGAYKAIEEWMLTPNTTFEWAF